MTTTADLARLLGAIDSIDVKNILQSQLLPAPRQIFSHLLVIDFEATCWRKNDAFAGRPEIIEFPAVLYDIHQRRIITEFQHYVMPTESPTLSPFCIELTGITQNQVNSGVPLATCLMVFQRWLQLHTEIWNLEFCSLNDTPNIGKNKCAVVTWSNWDLGTCLRAECKRKNIKLPEELTRWIDLRAIYTQHFQKPCGLEGALRDLHMKFEGKPHCGLHDARNTAYLAGKIIDRGVMLRLTKI